MPLVTLSTLPPGPPLSDTTPRSAMPYMATFDCAAHRLLQAPAPMIIALATLFFIFSLSVF